MSYIEKLLEACPELAEGKVEWKALGEIADVTKLAGYEFTKHVKYSDSGKIIAIRGLNVKNGALDLTSVKYIDNSEFNKLSRSKLYIDDMLFTYVGTIGQVALIDINDTYYLAPNVARIRLLNKSINADFIKFYFQSYYFKKTQINRYLSSSSMKNLTMANIRKFKIPIPPLSVQQEIVRILDKFTQLTAELTAELTARKKQYAYYRDELLSFKEGEVEWKTLGEVAIEFGRGKSKHRPRNDSRLYGGDTPLIQTGDIRNASHRITEFTQTYSEFGLSQSKLWTKGTLCITIAANIAETTILGFDSCFPDSIIGFIANPKETTENYVEYLLTSLKTKLESESTGSAQSNIKLATFKKLRFPFPSLSEQSRIVGILDKFDTLCSSISEGLPKEIELRQKQYEYYREKLLNFE